MGGMNLPSRSWGSLAAYFFGWLLLATGLASIGKGEPSGTVMYRSGIIVLMGAFAYRTKKYRLKSAKSNDPVLLGVEGIMLSVIVALSTLVPNLTNAMVD